MSNLESKEARIHPDPPAPGEPQIEACPECFQRGEILDIGWGSNEGACHTHKLRWYMWLATIPADLFQNEWEANREKIKDYRRVRAVMIKQRSAAEVCVNCGAQDAHYWTSMVGESGNFESTCDACMPLV